MCAGVVLGATRLPGSDERALGLTRQRRRAVGSTTRLAALHAVLNAITQLGSIYVVLGLCFVLRAVELDRTDSRSLVPFIVAVVGGEELLSTVIKDIVDRTRPAFNPAAATLGPSFPSGHSTTAAAFYAAAALLIGRRRSRATRAVVTGAGVGIAVAVAASRVLLDVHWFTDVIGGFALGWAWFALCAIAFGGRLLRFGVPLVVAEELVQPRAADGHVNVEARTTRPGRTPDAPGPALLISTTQSLTPCPRPPPPNMSSPPRLHGCARSPSRPSAGSAIRSAVRSAGTTSAGWAASVGPGARALGRRMGRDHVSAPPRQCRRAPGRRPRGAARDRRGDEAGRNLTST